jgi:hypothetical protein
MTMVQFSRMVGSQRWFIFSRGTNLGVFQILNCAEKSFKQVLLQIELINIYHLNLLTLVSKHIIFEFLPILQQKFFVMKKIKSDFFEHFWFMNFRIFLSNVKPS